MVAADVASSKSLSAQLPSMPKPKAPKQSTFQGPVVKLSPVVVRVQGYAARSYALTGMPDMMYLVGSGRSRLLIDAGEGRKEDLPLLIKAMEEVGCTKISDVLVTHYHPTYSEGVKLLREHFGNGLRVWSLPWSNEVVDDSFKEDVRSESESFTMRRVEVLKHGAVITSENSDATLIATVEGNIWTAEVRGKKMWIEATFAGTMKKSLVRSSRNLLGSVPKAHNKPTPQLAPKPEPTPAPEEPHARPLAPTPSPVLLPRKTDRSKRQFSRKCGCRLLLPLLSLIIGLFQVGLQRTAHPAAKNGTIPAQSNTALAVGTCPVKHLWYGCTRCVCSWGGLQLMADSAQNHVTMALPSLMIKRVVIESQGRPKSHGQLHFLRWCWRRDYDSIARAYFAHRTNLTNSHWREVQVVKRGLHGRI